MDIATGLGLLAGGVVLVSLILMGGNLGMFADSHAFIVIFGGSWLSEPVCQALEQEFGRPAISNQSCMIWDTLTRLGAWKPIPGQGRLLSAA